MELLKQLYAIHSPSGNEKRMRKFLKDWIKNNIPTASFTVDAMGNLYVCKGKSETYPCIVSHIDQVQKTHSKDFQAVETKDIIFGFSIGNIRMEGLGADDKNGIWIALKCLQKYPALKCAFFVQEEVGCRGSNKADMSFFNDARFVLQCDRKGGNDLIWNIGGYTELCSKEFLAATSFQQFGYKLEHGLMTDVEALKDNGLGVSAVNMSCGYYRPHTDEEYTKKSELLNCLAFVGHIIETCTDTYRHKETGGFGWGFGRYIMDDNTDEAELYDWITDFLFAYPDATLEDIIMEFEDYGFSRDQIEVAFEDVKSMYF